MSSFKPALIKPVYDVANFGHDTSLPLNCVTGSATTTLTPSTATFVQVLEDSKVPIDEVNQFITDSDEMALVHAGDDSDFDTTWEWEPDMSAQAYQISFNFAVGMKVSAYTSGNFKISDVQVITKQIGGGEGDFTYLNKIIDPGMSNMTSATEQVAIINFSTSVSAKVFDKPLTFQIKVNTDSGTGTYQTGIIPFFCYFGSAVPKTWTTSSVLMHIHADLAHAFPIFRDEDNMNMVDTGIGL
tara:strand:+ start:231 stop:956 length:726 start_codon:yes stop_codon:yes gene_type:complete